MFFKTLALISFFWLPEYSKPIFLVLFSRYLQCFPTADTLHNLSNSSLMKFICVIFRKKWSSSWGTNSLRILKQKLLLWKATGCTSPRLPASPTLCTFVFGCWVISHHHARSRGIWECASWEVLAWKSSVEHQGDQHLHNPNQTAWLTSRCLHHCSAKLASHAATHELRAMRSMVETPSWFHRSLKLCSQGRWLQTQLNGLLSD